MRPSFDCSSIFSLHAGCRFDEVDDIASGMGTRELARVRGKDFDFLRAIDEIENFASQPLGGEFWLGDQPASAGANHFAGVLELVAVGGAAKGDEDGGASGSGHFRGGN